METSTSKQYHNLLKAMEKISTIESYKSYDENSLNSKVKSIIETIQEIKQLRIDNKQLVKKFKDNYSTKIFKKKREKILNDIANRSDKHMSQIIDLHNSMTIMFQFAIIARELPHEIDATTPPPKLQGILKLSFLQAAFDINNFEKSADLLKTFNFYRNFFAHNDGKIIFRKTKIQKIDEILELIDDIKKFISLFETSYMNELRFAKNVFTLIDDADIVKEDDDFYIRLTINDGEKQINSIDAELLSDSQMEVFAELTEGRVSSIEMKHHMTELSNELKTGKIDPGQFLNKMFSIINADKTDEFLKKEGVDKDYFFHQMGEQLKYLKREKMK